jgi:hypothetical protein
VLLAFVLHIHLLPAIYRNIHPVALLSNRRAPFAVRASDALALS